MAHSAHEAEAALNEIERAGRRAIILCGYERGAPHLILWGVIWVVGYGLSDLAGRWAGPIWLVLTACGWLGGYLIGRATAESRTPPAHGWRYLAAGVALSGFVLATYLVMGPGPGARLGAFPPLVVALLYVLNGIWRGLRWVVTGVVVGALTVVGYMLLTDHFLLWMAVVGGGSLILSGLWLRQP